MMSFIASPRRLLRTICLALPLGVFLLPRIATTLEEDLLLALLVVIWLPYTMNSERRIVSEAWQRLLIGGIWGIVYAIAWMGLLRGYGEFGSILALLFPIVLIGAWALNRGEDNGSAASVHSAQWVLVGVGWLLALFFVLFWLFGNLAIQPMLEPSPFQSVAALALLPLLGLTLSSAPPARHSNVERAHLPLLAALLFATACVWTPNLSLTKTWWEAGRYERAWTPFRYDNPEYISQAEQAPQEAMSRYMVAIERLERKGRIPVQWGWRETLQTRAIEQGRRSLDVKLLLAALAASGEMYEQLVEDAVDDAFYDRLMNSVHDYERPEHFLWVDVEIDPDTGVEYRMDRWGRIYTQNEGPPQLVWRPNQLRDDAIDLEIFEGEFVILYADGTVLCSRPTDWLERPPAPLFLGGNYVDLEFLHHTRGALLVSSRGEIASLGDAPQPFPLWNEMTFDQDVIVDMEIDWDDRGYYLLDHFGAIHANHVDSSPSLPYRSPPVPAELVPYWSGERMARDLVIDPLRRGLSIHTRMGEVYTITTAPYRETYRPLRVHPFRGAAMTAAPDGSLRALEANGAIRRIPVGVTAPQ